MEWLGNRITNPINLSKFVLSAFALAAGSWAGTNWNNAGSAYPSGNDTTRVMKIGFESLFASEKYNPSLPYAALIVALCFILYFFPGIALWLPASLKG